MGCFAFAEMVEGGPKIWKARRGFLRKGGIGMDNLPYPFPTAHLEKGTQGGLLTCCFGLWQSGDPTLNGGCRQGWLAGWLAVRVES